MHGWPKWLRLGFWLAALPWVLGMGVNTGVGPTHIPVPPENFRVELRDIGGSQVTLDHFAIDSQTFVLGRLGEGELAVPFAKVKGLALADPGQGLQARVTLRDGQEVILALPGSPKATGQTSYGNFAIPLKEISSIQFKK
ncbi:MAG: hypothetical protein KQJ78_25030 [Deltaproteobacteria bacterium]|nr:hypothetical protein [Deltaproteobacteria bacterium]